MIEILRKFVCKRFLWLFIKHRNYLIINLANCKKVRLHCKNSDLFHHIKVQEKCKISCVYIRTLPFYIMSDCKLLNYYAVDLFERLSHHKNCMKVGKLFLIGFVIQSMLNSCLISIDYHKYKPYPISNIEFCTKVEMYFYKLINSKKN